MTPRNMTDQQQHVVRVRSPRKMYRIAVDTKNDDLAVFYSKVQMEVQDELSSGQSSFVISRVPQQDNAVAIDSIPEHGEIVFLVVTQEQSVLEVDQLLVKADGSIKRPLTDRSQCQHGNNGMCLHCKPMEPYDDGFIREKGIKHLSLHSYIRRQKDQRSALEITEPIYSAVGEAIGNRRPACVEHTSKGSCLHCRTTVSSLTLKRQEYRLVDHVEFDDGGHGIESFLARGWRATGLQHCAYLYGRYEAYDGVPLGVKAVVSAIHMPFNQTNAEDGFSLTEDQDKEECASFADALKSSSRLADSVAQSLGLECVGIMYTDLHRVEEGSGEKVRHDRGPDTFFLSGPECLFISDLQMQHPIRSAVLDNIVASSIRDSRRSSIMTASRFVTVILTGDEEGGVGVNVYQTSLQAQALVRSDLITATTDPSMLSVVELEDGSSPVDVLFSSTGGAMKRADPFFPTDFLLVNVTHGFRVPATPLFKSKSFNPMLTVQDLQRHLLPFEYEVEAMEIKLSCFAFVIALRAFEQFKSVADAMVVDPSASMLIAKAIKMQSFSELATELESHSQWTDLMETLRSDQRQKRTCSPGGSRTSWSCPHCTFVNSVASSDTCSVCGLPRSY